MLHELPKGNPVPFSVKGQAVVLVRLGPKVFAVADECSHLACRLSSGLIVDSHIECDCHGSRFDLASGAVVTPPATQPIRTFEVKIEAGHVFIEVD